MLDRLPAFVRHLIIAFVGSYMAVLLNAVLAAKGVSTLDAGVLVQGLDAAAYTTAGIALALYVTPLVKQYGVGKE